MPSRQYNAPLESTPTTLEAAPATSRQPLMIPRPNVDPPFVSLASRYDGMSTTLRLGKHTTTVWSMTWHNLPQPCQY
jgi:hypothetical protein